MFLIYIVGFVILVIYSTKFFDKNEALFLAPKIAGEYWNFDRNKEIDTLKLSQFAGISIILKAITILASGLIEIFNNVWIWRISMFLFMIITILYPHITRKLLLSGYFNIDK
ncbi:MAG: hypothetical protein FWF57_10315 [Defluviitaleaceae bacterium]|nr:hypothetical protein [Defluviitaleaceae bacterium]